MEEKLIKVLEEIVQLSAKALAQAKRDTAEMRKKFKLIEFNGDVEVMGRKKKLPNNVREFRPGYYQARKVINGLLFVEYASTPENASDKLKKAIAASKSQVDEAVAINPKKLTYGEWLTIWVDVYKKPNLTEGSLYQIDNIIRNHIPAWLKNLPLAQLTAILIQRALNEVESERMKEYTYTVYSDSLGWAYDLEYTKDIMRSVNAVKHERVTGRALSIEVQKEFLSAVEKIADIRLRKLFVFYLLSGVRPGEALTLTAKDFDYTNDVIHVHGTKNKYSDRFIPLFPEIKQLVENWLPQNDERLFPFTTNYISKFLKKILPGYTPKDLRHTYATRCKECGIPTDVYKQWLGHSKKSTVAETTYTHYETVNKIESKKFSLNPIIPKK